jgi:hypothetical protein
MVTQKELLKQHVLDGKTREELVEAYSTNMDRVRGSLSKAWNNDDAVSEVLKTALRASQDQTSYRLSQQKILTDSAYRLEQFREDISYQQGTKLAVFASDQHLPYIRIDYFSLLLQILEYFSSEIAYYSSLNDLFDFEGQGRWEQLPDERRARFDSNIQNNYTLARIITSAINRKIPKALKLGVTGNHDIRILHALRSQTNGHSEKLVLEYMNFLKELGVLQFANGTKREPIIQLSKGLKWVHGVSAAKNDSTIIKNTIEKAAGSDLTDDAGILYHTVSGHVHRPFLGSHMGVTHANSGCGCSLDAGYLKHATNRWRLGIVLTEFEVDGRGVDSTPLTFSKRGNSLATSYRGVHFSTAYDDTMYYLT